MSKDFRGAGNKQELL